MRPYFVGQEVASCPLNRARMPGLRAVGWGRRRLHPLCGSALALLAVAYLLSLPGCLRDGSTQPRGELTPRQSPVSVREIWRWSAPRQGSGPLPLSFLDMPLATDEVVLVGLMAKPRLACAIDAETGRTLWERPASLFAVAGSRAVILHDYRLECVTARDSKVLWAIDLSGSPNRGWYQLSIAGERIILASRAQTMCFDLRTGKRLWTYNEQGSYEKDGRVAVASSRGMVIVTHYRDGRLIAAVNAADGTKAWRYEPSSLIPFAPPWVTEDLVLVRTELGVEALESATGKVRWRTRQSLPRFGGVGVAMVGSSVYSVSGDLLRELNPTDGSVSRQRTLPEPLYGIPGATMADARGLLAIVGMRSRGEKKIQAGVVLFDPAAGEIVLSDYPFSRTVTGQLAGAGDRLFFIGFDAVAAFEIR